MKRNLPMLLLSIMSLMMVLSNDLSAQTMRPTAVTTKAKATTSISKQEAKKREKAQMRLSPSLLEVKTVAKKSALQSFRPFSSFPSATLPYHAPALAAGDGTSIYGCVIFADSWTEDNAPVGIYSFPAQSNTILTPVALNSSLEANGGGVYIDGKYYFTNYIEFFGMVFAYYNIYNTETWEKEFSASVTPSSIARDITYDPTSGKVYGCFYTEAMDGVTFSSMDLETGATTKISDLALGMYVIAANSKGDIYGIGDDGKLYSINKGTGALTPIGATGLTPKYAQSGSFDMKADKLYWAASLADGTAGLYEVNVTTGAATLVSAFSGNEEITGLYIPAPAAEDGAPAIIEDLTITFTEGATTGNVAFTMPVKTFNGQSLSGSLSYSIIFNGKEMATGTANAGAKVNETITVEPGMYNIVAATSNNVGKSPDAKSKIWIGKDAPKAVKNLKLEKGSAENKLILTWDAPTKSIHEGYMDVSSLNYKVIRYPEKKVVADKIKVTTFSEELVLGELTNFWYEVTAYAGDLQGETSTSNKIALGSAFTVPYFEGFNSQSDFDLFTIIDANEDGDTWSFDSKNFAAKCTYNSDNGMDDWLITPPIKLSADRVYKFYFRTKASSSFPEMLRVALGNDNTVEAMQTDILPVTTINFGSYVTIEKMIQVSTPGEYHIGFQSSSDPDMFQLFVDSIGIDEGAKFGAPEAVTELKAIPAEK